MDQAGVFQNTRTVLLSLCLLACVLNLWGIRRDLPYVHDYDEQPFVIPAYAMAATGGWNPHWFGHPGSTVIYPLRTVFAAWIAFIHGGEDFAAASIQQAFESRADEFYFIGRIFSITYLVASVPVLYFLFLRLFGRRVALVGSLLWIVTPLIVAQSQLTRSDSAIQFFGFATLLVLVKLREKPLIRYRLGAAALMACAVSSHYKMAFLGLLWLWIEWSVWRESRPRPAALSALLQVAMAALLGCVLFLALNPFLPANLDVLKRNLLSQTPMEHPGADGLSAWGNLLWYLYSGIPKQLGLAASILALIGFILAVRAGRPGPRLLVAFVLLYLLTIMWSPLHWSRWLTLILPALGALAVHALFALTEPLRAGLRRSLVAAGLLLLLLPSSYRLVLQNIRNSSFNTRLQTLQWIHRNVPLGSKIAYEWYTAPLRRQPYRAREVHALPSLEGGLQGYRDQGFEYLIVSSNMRNRFIANPGRYQKEVGFYRELAENGNLAASFMPSLTIGGPEIFVYRLTPSKAE